MRTLCSLTLVLALGALGALGCGPTGEEEEQGAGPSYAQASLTGQGFDFSSGTVPAADALDAVDAVVVNYAPYPTFNTQLSYLDNLWLEPSLNDDWNNFTRDLGTVALSEVLQVPKAWDAGADQTLDPLVEGHAYVVRCLDGYAKLKVRALRGADWELDVDYHFTSGETFDK